jgi:hypothetical protein
MDMLTPAGVVGISLALFGLPLLAVGGGLALVGLLCWVGVARASDGKARLGAARLPALLVGAAVGLGMLAAELMATQSSLGSLNGALDWGVFLAPGVAAVAGAALVAWPLLALLRPASGRAAEKAAV